MIWLIWPLLAIVPETAGGVLNSENEIRWPTGKKTILARQQCLWLPFKIFRFFETTFARFFLKRISSFFTKYLLIDFRTKLPFLDLRYTYDRKKTTPLQIDFEYMGLKSEYTHDLCLKWLQLDSRTQFIIVKLPSSVSFWDSLLSSNANPTHFCCFGWAYYEAMYGSKLIIFS